MLQNIYSLFKREKKCFLRHCERTKAYHLMCEETNSWNIVFLEGENQIGVYNSHLKEIKHDVHEIMNEEIKNEWSSLIIINLLEWNINEMHGRWIHVKFFFGRRFCSTTRRWIEWTITRRTKRKASKTI